MSCGANVRIGFWIELSGQRGGARGVARELLGARLVDGQRRAAPSNATV